MSLFDVIKYPISDPPTIEELEALPKELFLDFLTKVDWFIREETELIQVSRKEYTRGNYSNDIPVLRQMIKDYDEPI